MREAIVQPLIKRPDNAVKLQQEILTDSVMLCLSATATPGTFPGGQAIFLNPRVCICAQSFLFHAIVDFFATFLMLAAIRRKSHFALARNKIDLSGIHI